MTTDLLSVRRALGSGVFKIQVDESKNLCWLFFQGRQCPDWPSVVDYFEVIHPEVRSIFLVSGLKGGALLCVLNCVVGEWFATVRKRGSWIRYRPFRSYR